MSSSGVSPRLKSLGPSKFAQLVDLIGKFDREARRCAKAHAYYAACVMQAAVLEGMLIAMCDGDLNKVSAYLQTLPKEQRPKGQVATWGMNQLIKIAVALHWLPSRVSSRGRRKIGDWVALVKEFRNLVHPGKHVRDYPKVRLRKGHFSDSLTIVQVATDHLWASVTGQPPSQELVQKKGRQKGR